MATYKVKQGDSWELIAGRKLGSQRFHEDLRSHNRGVTLKAGMTISIPDLGGKSARAPVLVQYGDDFVDPARIPKYAPATPGITQPAVPTAFGGAQDFFQGTRGNLGMGRADRRRFALRAGKGGGSIPTPTRTLGEGAKTVLQNFLAQERATQAPITQNFQARTREQEALATRRPSLLPNLPGSTAVSNFLFPSQGAQAPITGTQTGGRFPSKFPLGTPSQGVGAAPQGYRGALIAGGPGSPLPTFDDYGNPNLILSDLADAAMTIRMNPDANIYYQTAEGDFRAISGDQAFRAALAQYNAGGDLSPGAVQTLINVGLLEPDAPLSGGGLLFGSVGNRSIRRRSSSGPGPRRTVGSRAASMGLINWRIGL